MKDIGLGKNVNNILENMSKLRDISDRFTPKKGVVEDIKDPTGQGRVKVRISGVQTASKNKVKTEDLIWTNVRPVPGAGGGKGQTNNLLIGQFVDLLPMNVSETVWEVVGMSNIRPDLSTEDNNYGSVAENDDQRIQKEIAPLLSSGDLRKLADTMYSIANSGLLDLFTGSEPGDSSPDLPPNSGALVLHNLDWGTQAEEDKWCPVRYSRELGSLISCAKIGQEPALDQEVDIRLVNESLGYPGGVKGYKLDGSEDYIKYTDTLYIPAILPIGDVTIRFEVKLKTSSTWSPCSVNILIYDQYPQTQTQTHAPAQRGSQRGPSVLSDINSPVSDINIKEPKLTNDKADPWYCDVKDNGVVQIVNDATVGNQTYGVYHTTDKNNKDPKKVQRLEFTPKGEGIVRTSDDLYLLSGKNCHLNVNNIFQQHIKTKWVIHVPLMQLKGDLKIQGNVKIEGTVDATQDITSDTDVIGGPNNISLINHIHEEPGGNKWKDSSETETKEPKH